MNAQTPYHPGARAHVALAVRGLEASLAFYRALLGREPDKVRPGYAKFDAPHPPLTLSLNESTQASPAAPPAHFGIRVEHPQQVAAAATRLNQAGLATQSEEGVSCCYAMQDKVWVSDPDGNAWEVYTVLADIEETDPALEPCCTPECCKAP